MCCRHALRGTPFAAAYSPVGRRSRLCGAPGVRGGQELMSWGWRETGGGSLRRAVSRFALVGAARKFDDPRQVVWWGWE